MFRRTIATPTAVWHIFDRFSAVEDAQVPEWALEEIGSGEAGLAEWNARKATALQEEHGYIIVRASPADWSREQVLDAVKAFDNGELAPLEWSPLSPTWLGEDYGYDGVQLAEPYPTG